MPVKPPIAAKDTAAGLAALTTPWRRSLAARRASPRTIATYTTSVAQFNAFAAAAVMPRAAAAIRREHVEAFIVDLLSRRAPGDRPSASLSSACEYIERETR
jgi:hypothetical protein